MNQIAIGVVSYLIVLVKFSGSEVVAIIHLQ
jgi:hypothetical protein